MAQRFLAQEALFEGVIKQNGTVSHDDHVVTRGYLHSNIVNAIHPDSANYASVVSDGGVNKLKIQPLTIVDTTVDSSNATIALFVSNVYTGANFQESDIVILTTASPSESWIHNGGTAGTAADWNLLNTQLSDSQVRALVSGGNALTYNSSTGVFDVVEADIQAMFSAGTGLAYSAGQFSLSASSDQISEGVSNLFFTTARMDAHLTAGAGLTFNAGEYSFTGSTDDVSEGSALYFTQARARGSVQADPAAGNLVTFNQSSGDVALMLSSIRKGFANQSLTANTGLALTHSLGERLVHVSAMDGSGNDIQLEKVYTSTTVVTIKSTINLTGIDIAVSI